MRHPSVSRSGELPCSVGSPVHVPQEGTRGTNKSASGWSRDVEDGIEEAGCVLQVPHPSVGLLQGTPLPPSTCLTCDPFHHRTPNTSFLASAVVSVLRPQAGKTWARPPSFPCTQLSCRRGSRGCSESNLPFACFFCFSAVAV